MCVFGGKYMCVIVCACMCAHTICWLPVCSCERLYVFVDMRVRLCMGDL